MNEVLKAIKERRSIRKFKADMPKKEDIEKIGEWIRGADRYVLQHFEDSGNLIGKNMHPVPREEMLEMQQIVRKYVGNAEVRGI